MTRPVLQVPVTGNLTEAGAASLALLRGSLVLTLQLFRDQQILEAAALGLSGEAQERFVMETVGRVCCACRPKA